MSEFDDPVVAQKEPGVMLGRRAFPEAQALMDVAAASVAAASTDVGWYGTDVDPEAGSFAVVSPDGALADLVGNVIRVTLTTGTASVCAYVIATAVIEQDIALYRRAFLSVAALSNATIEARVEVLT